MMTKKDYVKFADMIAERKSELDNTDNPNEFTFGMYRQLALIRDDMISLFKSDNPNFDETRFNEYIESKVKSLTE